MNAKDPVDPPVDRDALESERDFLLRSLDDLDQELADGGIDDDTYAVLHADYTARAASVARRLAGRPDATAAVASRDPRWGLTALALGIVVLTITLGVVIFAAPRNDGDSLTGNDTPSTTTISLTDQYDRLAAAVAADPEDLAARMDLGLFLFQTEQYGPASEQLLNAVRIAPDDLEAQTFYGWSVWQLAQQAPDGEGRTQLIDLAVEHLDAAIALAPDDPTATTFLGIVLYRGRDDAEAAVPLLERAVVLAGDQAPPMLSQTLEEARATLADPDTGTTTPTTKE